MTGEKLRSLRRDHKPSKEDGDLLEPGEEEAAPAPGGVFTGGRGSSGKGGRAGGHRIFSSHHHRLQLKGAPAPATPGGVSPAAEPDKCPGHFPVHECVFKGDVRRLSALIRTQGIGQKDSHGNTPLHLAVMLGHKECAHLLLAHNAPVKVKNAQGWSPLAEAISYGDRQMITALLRKLKQQSRESVEEKRPRLLKALKEVLGVTEAMPGHLLHLRVRIEGLVVNLVNIYAPTTSPKRPQFYQQVSNFLGTLDSHECLVPGGDFNTTLEEQDRSGAELNILRGIVEHHSLVDVWRDHHPDDTSTFTFVRVEAHRSHYFRLDRIYLSRFHLSQARSSNIRLAPFSDHHLATITASLRAERPGPAYWHFNSTLLEDEGFMTSFREFWLAWREQRCAFSSAWRWWDLGKVCAKLFCHDYTWGTSRRRNAAIEQLEREVLEMERRRAASPEDPFFCGACREKREKLRALEDHRARGAFVRSRIRLLREMDRGSRFFYTLEKTRGAKKHVTCLLAEDGTSLMDLVEMCGRACDFYTSLFSPDPTDPGACRVLWEELPTVSVGIRDQLELPLTLAEFSEALRRMPTNKSPGMDGLTVEFYHAFWDILGPDLATVWAESLQGGLLPLSCRRAVLALLPKKGDLCNLRNWRPVSLLSMDYKIVAKAILLRLRSVMADVIHPDQTYAVLGRSIFDNLFLVRDLLELRHRDGLSFALLSLDQEKAFDRVDHGYRLGTLQVFGFGPQFVSFLRVLYASAECLVRLNWTLTEPVSFGRGVRQGCPPSGQLYTLAIEPFLCLLRRRLTGLVLWEPKLRLVLLAYADDVLLMVQDPGDLARVEACQAIYSAASSIRVSWVKSSGLALGDFYLELHWDFQSWVPLLSRILPSDACKIYKQGINIRLDTTLIDFTDMKCQRGDLSFIFNGDAAPSESFVVLDNEQKVYQRIHHEESEMETEEEVDILMSSDIYSATLSTKSITFTRAQTGWLFREDKTERVGNFLADFYLVNGLVLESRKRREHLSEEDILRNKAIMESLSKGGNLMEQNFEPVRRQSLTPPPPNTITWEEYISAENGKAPHLGRELVCKESKKTFKATIAMSQEFPLGIESLLNVLEVIAPFKHFNKLREFVQMKLPPGFPVKLDIPVFPTITATVTFQEFRYDEFDESIFTIPDDYKEDPSRFPDL
ncbi:unnamed protein product [Caretta caretta]